MMMLLFIAVVLLVLLTGGLVALRAVRERQRKAELDQALAIGSDAMDAASQRDDGPGWFSIITERRNRAVRRERPVGAVSFLLEQARVPLRSSEFLLIVGAGALVGGVMTMILTGSAVLGFVVLAVVPFVGRFYLKNRIKRRRKALAEQFPEALSIMAASLRAGHTLHRAIDSYARSGEPPLAEEFSQVVAETHLGSSVVDAVQNMAKRVDLPEAQWLARAISIQYSVGGRLADLLENLSEITYSRQELGREVAALTAEGRASALMLGMLPPALLLVLQVTNPNYLEPMFSGWGLVALFLCALSVLTGVGIIRRMVNFEAV